MGEFRPTANISYALGGVPLDYVPWQWPLYRGTDFRVITITQGSQRLEELKRLQRETTLDITDPFGEVATIPAFLLSLKQTDAAQVEISLADTRWLMSRYHLPYDVNIRWGQESEISETGEVKVTQKYVRESAKLGKAEATAAVTSVPKDLHTAIADLFTVVKDAHGDEAVRAVNWSNAAESKAKELTCSDNTLIAGQTVGQGLMALLRQASLDITVDTAGEWWIVEREPVEGEDEALAGVDWVESRPSWEFEPGKRWDVPETVIVPYVKRVQFRARYLENATSTTPRLPHFKLTQKYQSLYGSGWVTLDQMLDEVNAQNGGMNRSSGFTLTASEIAESIYSGFWKGTKLHLSATKPALTSLAEEERVKIARSIVTVIEAHWRRHFSLDVFGGTEGEVPNGIESDGYFYDMRFGTISEDTDADADDAATIGTVRGQSVQAPWVELYRMPIGKRGGGKVADATALKWSQNAGGTLTEAPFTARWYDRISRIVEISPEVNRLVIDRKLGALARDDTVADLSESPETRSAIDNSTRSIIGNLFVRRRDITALVDARCEFEKSLEFTVGVVAKRRAPLFKRERFHEVEIKSDVEGATGTAFLPVDPIAVANIDPTDSAEELVLNDNAVKKHAERVAREYLAPFKAQKIGTHFAHGIGAAKSVRVDGSVREIVIECGSRGLATVLARVERGTGQNA